MRRCPGFVLAFLLWTGLSFRGQADSTVASTNAPPASIPSTDASSAEAPSTNAPAASPPSTNAAPSSLPENHPDLNVTPPGEQPSLSLRPDASSSGAPPEVSPAGSELFPQTIRKSNPMGEPEDLAAHLLVVYNSNDPDSREIAFYYASQRNIPSERVLGLNTSTSEEITRTTFERTIRVPIVSYLTLKDWLVRETQRVRVAGRYLDLLVATRNDIWAIALVRGVPLKIAAEPSEEMGMERQPEFQTNAAAVDSELALLPIYGLPLGGFVPNIFFDNQVSGIKRVGPELALNMVLVTRLDGPTPADVHRMIDDSIAAEKNRLAGLAVIDTRGLTDVKSGYTQGDVWLRSARDSLVQDGWSVKFDDKPELIPATDPCNQVALYLGWYSADARGPWFTPPNRFLPGAIAYHLHSFSASTVRSDTSNWVGPLIAHGADATMGMVYEPYLALTPHEDIFTRRLLRGDYFAEAAWASERGLSWMLTVVGDPLYRPFHVPLNAALTGTSVPHTDHDDWLLLQKVQRELLVHEIADTPDALKAALEVPGAGPVAEEGLGDLLEKINQPVAITAAEGAYQKAAAADRLPVDRVRVGLKMAQLYSDYGQGPRAESELDTLRELYPADAKRFGIADAAVPTSQPTTNSAPEPPPKSSP
jgi:uncharacterized protein (TIGR03790 family)